VDPTSHDAVARALAWLHPGWMLVSVVLVASTLRLGIRIRRLRLSGERVPASLYRGHLRLAKPAVALLLAGFLGGPLSSVLLRGWDPIETLHGVLGCVSALLFVFVAVQGRRLERGAGDARAAHGWASLVAVGLALVTALTGMVLLP